MDAPLLSLICQMMSFQKKCPGREEGRRCYERCVLTTTSLSRKDGWHCRKLSVETGTDDVEQRIPIFSTAVGRLGVLLYCWVDGRCVAVRADFLKYLLNLSRSSKRARKSRAFTEAWVRRNASAVSLVENPSTSRNTKTTRRAGRSSCKLLVNMSRSCETP